MENSFSRAVFKLNPGEDPYLATNWLYVTGHDVRGTTATGNIVIEANREQITRLRDGHHVETENAGPDVYPR